MNPLRNIARKVEKRGKGGEKEVRFPARRTEVDLRLELPAREVIGFYRKL